MKRPNVRRCSALVLLGLLALAALLPPPAAQGRQPKQFGPGPQQGQGPVVSGGGTDLFRAAFNAAQIEPIPPGELKDLEPAADLIVVVLGNPHRWQFGPSDPLAWVRRTLHAGGAALIASDFSFPLYTSADLNTTRSIGEFSGELVQADGQNREHTYNWHDDCPYAVPVAPDELAPAPDPDGRVWEVFRGLARVATNQPTYIKLPFPRDEYRYPLARLPRSAHTDLHRFERPPLFAAGNDGPPRAGGAPGYSFLAVADSSVFINQMLLEPGTDNRKLAFRTVAYLRGPKGERKRCLFFENGRVMDRFDDLRSALAPPLPPVPPAAMPNLGEMFGKNQEKLINGIDAKANQLQEQDALHKALVGPPGSERERRSAAGWIERTLVIASIAIVVFLLRKMWAVRHPQDAPPAPNTGAGAASTGAPGVFDRRQKELVRRNNLYEPVKALVREFLVGAGAPAAAGPRMPELEVSGAVRKPESLRQALRDLWRLAYGPPTTLTAQRWYELEPYFERLKRAHADGKWRFVL